MECTYNPVIHYYDSLSLSWKTLKPFYKNVNYTNKLNEIPTASFTYPLEDISVVAIRTKGTKIRIYENSLCVFSGFVQNHERQLNNGEELIKFQLLSLAKELADKEYQVSNVLIANELITDLLNPAYINSLVPNTWSTSVEPTNEALTYLTSLQSKLSTYQIFRKYFGYSWRHRIINSPSFDEQHLDFGLFGQYNGVQVKQTPKDHYTMIDNWLVVDENGVNVRVDGDHVINSVFPTGGAGDNGMNTPSLRDSVGKSYVDPSFPIQIDSATPNTDSTYNISVYNNGNTAPNTHTQYFMADQTSINAYGLVKRAVVYKDVEPLSANKDLIIQADRDRASEMIYKATKQLLIDHAMPLVVYNFGAIGHAPDLNVGDKIRLTFKKNIYDENGNCITIENIDEEFYVISYSCEYSENATKKYSLEVSNLPLSIKSDIDMQEDIIETLRDYERQRKGSVSVFPQNFERVFDATNPAECYMWIPRGLTYTDYLDLKVTIKPFISTVTGATSPAVGSTVPSATTSAGGGTTPTTTGGGGGTSTSSNGGATTQSSTASANHTHDVTIGNHTHSMGIGIGNSVFGTPVFYRPAFPGLFTNGGGAIFTGATTGGGGGTTRTSTNSGSHSHNTTIGNHAHTITLYDHTHQVTIAPHSHVLDPFNVNIPTLNINLTYGVFKSTTPPVNVRILIDGVDYSSELGTYSAFGEYPSGVDQMFDLMLASYNLGQIDNLLKHGRHKIEVYCQTGGGTIEISTYNQFYLSSR